MADYQYKKRKTFEDALRRNRNVITNWIKYAQWEESQKEIQRARSVFERALDVDHRNITLWLKVIAHTWLNKDSTIHINAILVYRNGNEKQTS